MTELDTMRAFESIGDNCEFGFVQEHFGYNPISLLRWAGCSIDGLVRALEADFADLFRFEDLRPYPPGALYDSKYDLYYSVALEFDADRAVPSEANLFKHRRLLRDTRYRLRLFHETLADQQKILVFKSGEPLLMGDLLRLKSALDLRGPQKLLFVVAATPDRPAGTVQRIASGVKIATLAGFAEDLSNPPHRVDIQGWLAVCTEALAGDWGHGNMRAKRGENLPQAPRADSWTRALRRVIA